MNYAVIDLGSNSVRLSVYEYTDGNPPVKVFSRKEIAGLAGYVSEGRLEEEGILKACDVLNAFRKTADDYAGITNLHVFATASLRNIENRGEAVRRITEAAGIVPDVLDGDEEAVLCFAGVSRFTDCENGIMIDIGGASTEFVLFKDYKPEKMISLPIGCLNLSLDYISEIMPDAYEMKQIKAVIKEQISKIDWGKNTQCPLMVGAGGTLRAALKLSRAIFSLAPEETSIDAGCIKEINKMLKQHKYNIYRTLYKNTPERLLTVPAGLAILQQAIKTFGCSTITVSRYGLREGYLTDRVLKIN